MSSRITAGISVLIFAVLGFAWTILEVLPPALGYEDTDNPEVMVGFIRDYPQVYRFAGVVLILASFTLTVAVAATYDRLTQAAGRPSLTLRVSGILGLIAAGLFLPLAGLRLATGSTLLLVDDLNEDWSQSAYMAFQMVGTQALAAGAVIGVSAWAVGLGVHGIRTGTLPTWLCVLAAIPGLRLLVGLLAPFGTDSSVLWVAYMLAIPGTTIWFVCLGVVLLRQGKVLSQPPEGLAAQAA